MDRSNTSQPCTCNQREIYQSPACIRKADSIYTYSSACAPFTACRYNAPVRLCLNVKSTFFNRKSGFLNRKSGFFNRKSGFFH